MKTNFKFKIDKELDKVWDFLLDLEKCGKCMPGVVDVMLIDDRTAEWILEVKLGFITKKIKLKTVLVDKTPKEKFSFHGESDMLDLDGEMIFIKQNTSTELNVELNLKPKGSMAIIINNVIEKEFKDKNQEFIENVKKNIN